MRVRRGRYRWRILASAIVIVASVIVGLPKDLPKGPPIMEAMAGEASAP